MRPEQPQRGWPPGQAAPGEEPYPTQPWPNEPPAPAWPQDPAQAPSQPSTQQWPEQEPTQPWRRLGPGQTPTGQTHPGQAPQAPPRPRPEPWQRGEPTQAWPQDPWQQDPWRDDPTRTRRPEPGQAPPWDEPPHWNGWEQHPQAAATQAPPTTRMPPGRASRPGGPGDPDDPGAAGSPRGPWWRRRSLLAGAAMLVLAMVASYLFLFRGGEEPTATPPTTAAQGGQQPQQPQQPRADRARPGVMPTEKNTGVIPGTKLRPSEELTVTEEGAVVENLDINGCLKVEAPKVTVRNTRIRGEDCDNVVELEDNAKGAVLEDVEIDGGGNPDANGVAFSEYTLRRGYIHGVGDGAKAGDNTTIESTYIHDLAHVEGSHNDGIQVSSGSNVVLRGNRVVNGHNQTGAIFVGADLGDISDVLVEANWLDGGGYTVYAGDGNKGKATGVRIVNNVFGRGAEHGPKTTEGDGIQWSGNRYVDGEEIPLSSDDEDE